MKFHFSIIYGKNETMMPESCQQINALTQITKHADTCILLNSMRYVQEYICTWSQTVINNIV